MEAESTTMSISQFGFKTQPALYVHIQAKIKDPNRYDSGLCRSKLKGVSRLIYFSSIILLAQRIRLITRRLISTSA